LKVTMSAELDAVLGADDRGNERHTSRPANSVLASRSQPTPMTMADIDAVQRQAAERWRDKHRARQYEPSAEPGPSLHHEKDLDATTSTPDQRLQRQLRLEHPGPEDNLEL